MRGLIWNFTPTISIITIIIIIFNSPLTALFTDEGEVAEAARVTETAKLRQHDDL